MGKREGKREGKWERKKEEIGYSLFTALKGFVGLMVFGWILATLMK